MEFIRDSGTMRKTPVLSRKRQILVPGRVRQSKRGDNSAETKEKARSPTSVNQTCSSTSDVDTSTDNSEYSFDQDEMSFDKDDFHYPIKRDYSSPIVKVLSKNIEPEEPAIAVSADNDYKNVQKNLFTPEMNETEAKISLLFDKETKKLNRKSSSIIGSLNSFLSSKSKSLSSSSLDREDHVEPESNDAEYFDYSHVFLSPKLPEKQSLKDTKYFLESNPLPLHNANQLQRDSFLESIMKNIDTKIKIPQHQLFSSVSFSDFHVDFSLKNKIESCGDYCVVYNKDATTIAAYNAINHSITSSHFVNHVFKAVNLTQNSSFFNYCEESKTSDWLLKQSLRKWGRTTKRYFVLRGNKISYYKSPLDIENQKYFFDIQDSSSVLNQHKDVDNENMDSSIYVRHLSLKANNFITIDKSFDGSKLLQIHTSLDADVPIKNSEFIGEKARISSTVILSLRFNSGSKKFKKWYVAIKKAINKMKDKVKIEKLINYATTKPNTLKGWDYCNDPGSIHLISTHSVVNPVDKGKGYASIALFGQSKYSQHFCSGSKV